MRTKQLQFVPDTLLSKIGFDSIKEQLKRYLNTPEGHSLLHRLHPAGSPEAVDHLSRQTTEMLYLFQEEHEIFFSPLSDLSHWLKQSAAEGSILPLESFPEIAAHLREARLLRTPLQRVSEQVPTLWTIASDLTVLKELEERIDQSIDPEGGVRNHASPELQSIRKQMKQKRNSLRTLIDKLYRKATRDKMASDEGPTLREGRMVIPVKVEYRRKVNGFVHDLSASGQTAYVEPVESLQLNNDLRELEAEEKREITRILRELTSRVRRHRIEIQRNEQLLGELDLIHARSRLGNIWSGVLPTRTEELEWRLWKARNPGLILKFRSSSDSGDTVVPLDLQLGENESGILISGPNAGGKSVALKTVALLNCMYQCGIPVPVGDGSEMPVVSGLYLDMGDDQSIEQDLSTFSSRLQWMQQTLGHMDETSLVLIDEAGTGTDPDEGSALFQAFIEQVLRKGARLIATTHHGSLKGFAYEHPKLANAAMEFDQESLAPTYRFRKGVPGSSYAFEIANRMNLPAPLLQRARDLLGDQRERLSGLLSELEKELQETAEEKRNLRGKRLQADREISNFQEKSDELKNSRKEILQKSYREADRIMAQANRKIEQAVEEIQTQGEIEKKSVKAVRQEIEAHKQRVRKGLQESMPEQVRDERSQPTPRIGDHVQVNGTETTGELVDLDGDRAVVLSGGLRIKTRIGKLLKSDRKQPEDRVSRWKKRSGNSGYSRGQVGTSLSLRGLRGNEAVRKLTLYIDQAVANGLQSVDIIHGKGDGILRKLVHEHLEGRKEVRSFELAPWERGGAGCTVVELH
ncbi:MAG: endonuclease MutS2 [Balneolaceae bacterium]